MREYKGKSFLYFPDDYIVIDIETTGLSPDYDSIIEICALKYRNRKLTDKFTSLVNPECKINDFIINLTGITNEMLSTAPLLQNVLNPFNDFIGNDILVGHSVNFDINFIYDAFEKYLQKPLSNNYIDTLRLARHMHKDYRHNRLSDLSSRYGLSYENAHRAEYDCLLTNDILNIFRSEYNDIHGTLENVESILCPKSNFKVSDITTNKITFDETHPLFGKTIVFTGTLEKLTRKAAMQIVVDLGGINGNSVTKDTNYLVLGNNDYCKSIKGGKSSKQKKAEQNMLSGQDIQIIPENVFYDMVPLSSYQTNHISNDTLMTTDIFTEDEIYAYEFIKNLLLSNNRDITYLRCMLQSNKTFIISNFYKIITLKLRGKQKYFILHHNIEDSSYDLSSFNYIEHTGRYYIDNVHDLEKIQDLLLFISDCSFDSFMTYKNNVKSAQKNLKEYLKTWYYI